MIRTAIVAASLAAWPALGAAQSEPLRLEFAAGPLSGLIVPAAAERDPAAEPPSADEDEAALLEAVRQAEQAVEREEAANGPSSLALVEPLTGLAELYRRLGDHPLAVASLARARQIVRLHDGLHALSQVEIVQAMILAAEVAGAYRESEVLQAELLDIANRNAGDPRVPSIMVWLGDRQMDAVRTYVSTRSWPGPLERLEAPGWDLDYLAAGIRQPLNSLETAILDTLTSDSYEVGTVLDAREVLADTYARIDAINDQNEVAQRRPVLGGLLFEGADVHRDLALSAFRRARRFYSTALRAELESAEVGSGEHLATEQKIIDTYYFEARNLRLYPDIPRNLRANDRRGILQRSFYGIGTSVLEARVLNLMSVGASAVEIGRALLRLADWHLLFSKNSRALELYQQAHDFLVREAVPADALAELVSPATPVALADLTTDPAVELDPTRAYSGYVDVAVTTGRFGDVKDVVIVGKSAGTSPAIERRARTHVSETRFRPRFEDGQPRRADRFELRYYYEARPIAAAAE